MGPAHSSRPPTGPTCMSTCPIRDATRRMRAPDVPRAHCMGHGGYVCPGARPAPKSMPRPSIPMLYPETSLPPPAQAAQSLPSRWPACGRNRYGTSPLPSRGPPTRGQKGGKRGAGDNFVRRARHANALSWLENHAASKGGGCKIVVPREGVRWALTAPVEPPALGSSRGLHRLPRAPSAISSPPVCSAVRSLPPPTPLPFALRRAPPAGPAIAVVPGGSAGSGACTRAQVSAGRPRAHGAGPVRARTAVRRGRVRDLQNPMGKGGWSLMKVGYFVWGGGVQTRPLLSGRGGWA